MAGRFSGAYLAGGERAALGWPNHFARPDDRAAAVAKAAARRAAPEALAALGSCVGDSAARARQLSRLEREGAVAVVTGQQVGLLLGPLYTIYKAASAIQVARALEAETGRPAVPVFWIQDEDHDFEEVAQAVLPRSGEPLRLGLAPNPAQARVSMAHRVLGPGIAALQDALQTELGRLPHGPEHLAALARAYRPEATWPQAFQALMAELFEPEGLLFLDPRSAPLMRSEAVRRVHARALTDAGPLAEALAGRARQLEVAGFGVPVHIREASPLSFFHPEGPEGPRYRLEHRQDGLHLVGGPERAWSVAELQTKLEADPACFSTSALLRPLLQDSLLPTAAYVGGPGEVDYFAQLPPLYEAFGLPPPLLVPRARFRVLEDKTTRLLEELGLTPEEAEGPADAVLARANRDTGAWPAPERVQADLLDPFTAALSAARGVIASLDPGLDKNAARTEETVRQAVGKLVDKYRATLLRRDETRVATVERLQAALRPDGAPQERVYALSTYAARYGARRLVELALAGCDPFDPRVKDILP